jgi:NitT/TauT family transport system ATP-binding protein
MTDITTARSTTSPHAGDRPAKVSFRNITKEFVSQAGGPAMQAIDGLSLDIAEKDFVCLIGPSGCGKSTLLNMIAGFEKPSSGEVLLDGVGITGPGADRGVVFQEGALFPWLNVFDNVCYGPRRLGVPGERYLADAHAILDEVGLSAFAKHLPAELSGGMRQRVAIARALINRPPVLLMDEPFGALDPTTRLHMQQLLVDLWKEAQATVFFVTHSIEEAIYLGDRVYVFSSSPGTIIREMVVPPPTHPPKEMLREPSFVERVCEIRDVMDTLATSTRAGD